MDAHELSARYRRALDSFVEKANQDSTVLAVVLLGSLSYDVVWERSDIDLFVITREVKLRVKEYMLVEDGINVHAGVLTRSEFKKMLEGSMASSFLHSILTRGTLVYCRDETLAEAFAQRHGRGDRDHKIAQLRSLGGILGSLDKAQKWLYAKDDPDYSFVWTLRCLDSLATLVVVRHGEVPDREAILHARRLAPAVIDPLYAGLIHGPKDRAALASTLAELERYILDAAPEVCAVLFDYLGDSDGVRRISEITEHFDNNYGISGAGMICEWLADRGLIDKVSAPVRLTEKSRVEFEEAAFYWEG